jgi:N-methylhydantoinase A/oxoprolinase/acetone carboxylase beta subunit
MHLEGPAVIEMPETTIVLRPGSAGRLDEYGNFVIEIE